MIKKILATTAILGSALGGVMVAAPAASADSVACRAFTNPDANGVQLAPCWSLSDTDNAHINAMIGVNSHGRSIDPCAQLVNVATGAWAVNYGCVGWVNTGNNDNWYYLSALQDVNSGTYVVQEGYWAYDAGGTLRYYDNVQSPVIYD
ncbi:MAG TPA: hypothetical protein VL551_05000 [Actinospica sp.]|nr:hypothetical protein [Actinospica sp.]